MPHTVLDLAVPFGGGGALHVGALIRDVGLKAALVPRYPGVTSALGCIIADVRHDQVRTLNLALDSSPTNDEALQSLVQFYKDAKDITSARVHLNRVAGTMRARVQANPQDGAAYRVISRAMAARAASNAPGSPRRARRRPRAMRPVISLIRLPEVTATRAGDATSSQRAR